MIVALDVDYRNDAACIGVVQFRAWTDEAPTRELAIVSAVPAENYRPGEFYRRELPFLLQGLAALESEPNVIVIDGYVWLADDRPGLGAHLFQAIRCSASVVGVAKNHFRGSRAVPVLRGASHKPLFVTAAGMSPEAAAAAVSSMAGEHRVPTMLKRADQLARGHSIDGASLRSQH